MEDAMDAKQVKEYQQRGISEVYVRFPQKTRGCLTGWLVISGQRNGNKNDLWLDSRNHKKTIARIYLGSPKMLADNIELLNGLREI
jgi:hypothetical protein